MGEDMPTKKKTKKTLIMNIAGQKTKKCPYSGTFCVQFDTYVSFFLMEVEKHRIHFQKFIYLFI